MRATVFSAELTQKYPDQRIDVVGPAPERRQLEFDDAETVIEVFPERPLLHSIGERSVARGDDPGVDMELLPAAQAHETKLLHRPEELGLQSDGHLPDLVQEEGSPIRQLECAGLALSGSGEGALLIAEQFALHQIGWQRRAVDGDERPLRTTGLVDEAGEDVFARSALACDQDGHIRPCDSERHLPHTLHARILGDPFGRINSWIRHGQPGSS